MSAVQKTLDALSSPIRREILWLIWDRELPAGEIAAAVDVTAPTVSEHLSVLRDAGLVTMQASGSFRLYRARQDSLRRLPSLVFGEAAKWVPADNLPERRLATSGRGLVVTAAVEVECDRPTVFAAFTDAQTYSRWLGAPVTIDDGRFACRVPQVRHDRARRLRPRGAAVTDRPAVGDFRGRPRPDPRCRTGRLPAVLRHPDGHAGTC